MFFLVGPTAVGKSEIAIDAALRTDAEIVGADAFQVYQGLDLLTAKPPPHLRAKVPHHLIGEIPLREKFDVGRYREMALARVREIEARGKRALVVGGTGLYIRALTHGLSELPGAAPALRAELDTLTLSQLQERYAALDPRGSERIDRRNRRRLVRAIEVSLLAGAPFSSLRADWSGKQPAAAASGIALEINRDQLHARIDARVRRIFAQGVVDEVRAAEAGPTAAQAIGYAEIKALLRRETSVEECIKAIQQRTRQYAKRQLTWLRRDRIFPAIDLTDKPQSPHSPHGPRGPRGPRGHMAETADAIAQRIMAGYCRQAGSCRERTAGQIDS
jgi:tRNA dimethylallyltransferase